MWKQRWLVSRLRNLQETRGSQMNQGAFAIFQFSLLLMLSRVFGFLVLAVETFCVSLPVMSAVNHASPQQHKTHNTHNTHATVVEDIAPPRPSCQLLEKNDCHVASSSFLYDIMSSQTRYKHSIFGDLDDRVWHYLKRVPIDKVMDFFEAQEVPPHFYLNMASHDELNAFATSLITRHVRDVELPIGALIKYFEHSLPDDAISRRKRQKVSYLN